jgi:hypothetical protein
MKKALMILMILSSNSFGHNTCKPDTLINVVFRVYEHPLRLNQVESQEKIDFSKPEGLLQSFYSANNLSWALSDYLFKQDKIIRDSLHFENVKKRNVVKNYIQVETTYRFTLKNREIVILKYAFIIKDFPFPLFGILVMEKKNGRWYISNLPNQNQITTIILNIQNSVLLSLFSGKSKSKTEEDLIVKTKDLRGYFSFVKMDEIYSEIINSDNIRLLDFLRDVRLLKEGSMGSIANFDANFKEYKFKVVHSF